MGSASNTVGLDTTSAAIARGEVGANYSRYSTGNLAALAGGMGAANAGIPSSASRMSMMSTSGRHNSDEGPIELDNMPAMYAAGPISPGIATPPVGRSRFSEYGLEAGSPGSPSFKDSTLYDNRRDSMQYYAGGKTMEDTSLLWNEKNVEADEYVPTFIRKT